MLETNRREVVGKTILDFSKILFAGLIASNVFVQSPTWVRVVVLAWFVVLFVMGWVMIPKKKE